MRDDTRTVVLDVALLKALRRQRGWTQSHLADELKCTRKTVQNWERGNPVYISNARQLEELFGCKLTIEDSVEKNSQIAPRSSPKDQDRAKLIETVRRDWLQPFLSSSLATRREILLDLTSMVRVVDHPTADLPLPSRQSMEGSGSDFAYRSFLDFGRTLLILGAPGAGKTTLMFQLANILLGRAELDENMPVPVVFFLSSWNSRHRRLDKWLTGELVRRFPLSTEKADNWVSRGMITPLLDGLDEVAPEHQTRCLTAINDFLAEQSRIIGSVSTILCCRSVTYESLGTQLGVGGAVEIASLPSEKVEAFLKQEDPDLSGAHMALKSDPTLIDVVDSPLMLDVLIKACQGRSRVFTVAGNDKQQRYAWLFDAYVDEIFHKRGKASDFSQEETVFWLTRLAQLMRENREKVFYLDSIQPGWLQRDFEVNFVVLIPLLISGSSTGVLFGTATWLALGHESAIPAGTLLGLVGPILFWRLGYGDEIHAVERLGWSWQSFVSRRKEISRGALLFGAVFGSFGFIAGGLFLGVAIGLLSSVLFAIFFGLPGRVSLARMVPNQRIRGSLINFFVVSAVSTGFFDVLFNLWLEPAASLAFGLGFGLVTGLFNGGHACIQHAVLRLVLWKDSVTPLDYLRFLRFSAKVGLLRQIGGGFMFVHDLLEEHFANKLPDHEHNVPKFGKTSLKSSDRERTSRM